MIEDEAEAAAAGRERPEDETVSPPLGAHPDGPIVLSYNLLPDRYGAGGADAAIPLPTLPGTRSSAPPAVTGKPGPNAPCASAVSTPDRRAGSGPLR